MSQFGLDSWEILNDTCTRFVHTELWSVGLAGRREEKVYRGRASNVLTTGSLSLVGLRKVSRGERKSLNIRVSISQGNYDSPIFVRYSQRFVPEGRNLRRFIKITLGKRNFFNLFLFLKIKLPMI